MVFEEKEKTPLNIEYLITESITDWSIIRKTNITLFIINVLEQKGKISKELKEIKKEIKAIYKNPKTYRLMNYRDSLMRQNRPEYFGKDYGEHDPYQYDKKIEDFVIKLNFVIIDALAKAYLQLQDVGEIDIENF